MDKGGRPRINSVNEDFFTERGKKQAYIFGFFLADGSITSNGYQLEFTSIHRSHLKKVKEILETEAPIRDRKNASSEYHVLRIYSKKMVQSLMDRGVTTAKSENMPFPNNIPENCMEDFFRGYFDGDGSVMRVSQRNAIRVSFTSKSGCFLQKSQNFLNENVCMSGCLTQNSLAYMLHFTGQNALKFYNYIYDDTELHLEPKKNKFDSLVSQKYGRPLSRMTD